MNIDKLIRKADILIDALPYIQKFSGKTVVVKYGGNAMISEGLKNSVIEDVTLLKFIGLNPVIVHGGGPDITAALRANNIESSFMAGLRVTDAATMEIAQMVMMGKTNIETVSLICQKGGRAIGLSGVDGGLITCSRYKPVVGGAERDIGFVGKIENVNADLLGHLIKDEYIPVIAPIGTDEAGQTYNINADSVAAAVAISVKAEKLIFLTDVDGVQGKDNGIIHEMDSAAARRHIEDGTINGGMVPKVLACVDAIGAGVNRVHIIDGRVPHALLLEIFTNEGIGTMIKS